MSPVTIISWGKYSSSQHKILMSVQLLGLMRVFNFFFFFSQYPSELGLAAAFVFSTLVCLSRLYTGMHTVLVRMSLSSAFLQQLPSPPPTGMCALPWPCHHGAGAVVPLNLGLCLQRKPSGYCNLSPQAVIYSPGRE